MDNIDGLITKDDVYRLLSDFRIYIPADIRHQITEKVKALPSVDVQEVKHGRWILDKEGTELVCSVCGGFAPLNYFKYHRVRAEYCPNCGTKIDCKKEE